MRQTDLDAGRVELGDGRGGEVDIPAAGQLVEADQYVGALIVEIGRVRARPAPAAFLALELLDDVQQFADLAAQLKRVEHNPSVSALDPCLVPFQIHTAKLRQKRLCTRG